MEKKAIAYVADIMLGNTGEIIDRALQKQRIEQYAEENNITIVRWFEDGVYTENLFSRPQLKEMIACEEPCEYLLVERTWAISRRWSELKAFVKLMEAKKVRVDAATTLWDCVSQMARNYYRNPHAVAACSLEAEPCTAKSVSLGEKFGRTNQNPVRAVVKANGGTSAKTKVKRPSRLVLDELHYESA